LSVGFGFFLCFYVVHMLGNGRVYETFGISKHFRVKLQVLLIRAEMLDNPLTAKCFIYDVGHCVFIFYDKLLFYYFLKSSYNLKLGNLHLLHLLLSLNRFRQSITHNLFHLLISQILIS